MLYRDPCVFVVGREYQIVFNVKEKGIAWVEIGGETFRDSEGGLMRSEEKVHRVTVPQSVLDAAGSYRVCFRALPVRRPYFPELGEQQTAEYRFIPAPQDANLRILLMTDTHSMIREPSRAAKAAGDFDLLVLGGDIPAESKRLSDIRAIFDITSNVTHGEKPVVFVQGNHDYRGRLATELGRYVGRRDGTSWFTFRIGALWGIVLDCGEDKNDTNVEYGGLVDCHTMRLQETEWLRGIAADPDGEYNAPGVTVRLAFCHIPFCTALIGIPFIDGKLCDPSCGDPKFDIEKEIYGEWARLLEKMHPQVLLSAHTHILSLSRPGAPEMRYGISYPVLVGSCPVRPNREHPDTKKAYRCTLLTLRSGHMTAQVASDDGTLTDWDTVY